MTMEPICDLCGNPTDGHVCPRCTDETAGYLRHVVDLAGEVETNVARLARYATRSGRRAVCAEQEAVNALVNRGQPVMVFGFAASRERQLRNALRAVGLPVDLNASARAAVAFNHVTTWARTVEDDRRVRAYEPTLRPICALFTCGHESCTTIRTESATHPATVAARFLLEQLDWMRHQPFADEAFEQLRAAGAVIKRIVDRPPDTEIVGVCDCGGYLYVRAGAATVTCQCKARWDVEKSREGLRETLRGYLMTAAEAAVLLAFFGLTGDRNRSRKTIVMWAQRGHLQAHGQVEGGPAYLFGEVLDRATRAAGEKVSA